ncbi:MAG: S8 family serine peptidase [Oscillospiraceae bacterium]
MNIKIKRRKNKKSILIFSFFVLLIASISVLFIFFRGDNSYDNDYIDDWAISNYGQVINKSKGKSGVDINIKDIWKTNFSTNKVVVAVVDSGLEYSCESLKDKVLMNINDPIDGADNDLNGFIDDYWGWNFYDENNSLFEDSLYDYHGTYIATTVVKIAPNAQILPVKFLNATSGTVEDALLALEYAVRRGAKVVNCSWNFNDKNDALLAFIKNNPEVLFVCAAGNSNINLDIESIYPCSYNLDNIINVMAIDNKGLPYQASGYGKNCVDIASPGVDVKVTFPENESTFVNGTSVATAFVSATAALILSNDSNLSPKSIKEIIIANATKTQELSSFCKSGGYLNVKACLDSIK